MKLVVVSAGLSVPSSTRLLGDRLAAAARAAAPDGPDAAEVRVIELRDLAVEIAHTFTNGFAGRSLTEAYEAVTRADGLIVVTPVFSASYSGLFKSFFDGLSVSEPDALAGKPVLVAATGGTARHSLVLDHALRPLFSYLKAVVAPTGVFAASEDWGAGGLDERIGRAARELVALAAPASAAVPGAPDTAPDATPDAAPPNGSGPAPGTVPGPASDGLTGVPGGRAMPARDTFDEVVPFEERLAALRPTG
ncbi:CE1759 family FMN reductase [Streptomyces sp. NPDC029526]|uniref:CE1759 family FMN reductase n=1 Tax=Streptomyces sp. NPDC029526 TaxID=3155728 RepID=UPI0033C9A540